MESTDRREFLASLTAAAGSVAAPGWLAKWFSPQDPAAPQAGKERAAQLRAAVEKAKSHGKPLLVFVVPAADEARETYERGSWLGAWLNHGGSVPLLEIALCVPACATIDEVRAATGAAPIDGKPWMLVVDVSKVGAKDAEKPLMTPLAVDLGLPRAAVRIPDEAGVAEETKALQAGLETLTAKLHETIHRHGSSTAKLVADARATMSDTQRAAIAAWLAGGKAPGDELAVRAAAEVRELAAAKSAAERQRVLDELLAAIRRELVKKRIPGSRWASSMGCGTTIEATEGEPEVPSGVACGMGRVPAMCERFLDFYTGS